VEGAENQDEAEYDEGEWKVKEEAVDEIEAHAWHAS
jgi:hypothetical protein